ncbi:MAG TPA: acyl-ACP desaturase [Acidimicrobiales bacterium]|nr:acyl-ACP desaturase [Acidimicrobiales bacterium]
MEPSALLEELEPAVARLLDTHLAKSKEWFPHELVPWGRARDFEPDEEWDPREYPVPDGVRSALFLNLLTEDNLPYYSRTIQNVFGEGAWGEWARRWTAEEGRHSIVIRDYLTVTRALDAVDLERARMRQVSDGITPEPDNPADTMVYVALQELATRIAHFNTGKLLTDPAGRAVMSRVAADENHHFLFYRGVTDAALELDPSGVVEAIARQVLEFKMPGKGVVDFDTHSRRIAQMGIYDLIEYHDNILVKVVLNHWKVESLEGLSAEAEQAREQLVVHIHRLGKVARRMEERRAAEKARAPMEPALS